MKRTMLVEWLAIWVGWVIDPATGTLRAAGAHAGHSRDLGPLRMTSPYLDAGCESQKPRGELAGRGRPGNRP